MSKLEIDISDLIEKKVKEELSMLMIQNLRQAQDDLYNQWEVFMTQMSEKITEPIIKELQPYIEKARKK